MFVHEPLPLNANALDHGKLVPVMTAVSLLHIRVAIPITKARRSGAFRWIIVAVGTKRANGAGSLSLHHFEPPLFHSLAHLLAHLFNTVWWRRWPDLKV